LLGFILVWRIPLCPSAVHDGTAELPAETVSIIIPARNEAARLPCLLASIAKLHTPPAEVIVMDDGSTDGTAEVAAGYGVRACAVPALPDGWRGKNWACWNGAAQASGSLLLFLDADTLFAAPDSLTRLQAAWRACGSAALSLAPYHQPQEAYEQLSAIFNLQTVIGINAFSMFGSPHRPQGLFGPDLLIDRAGYMAIDGHRSVRHEVLEHMSMGLLLKARNIAATCLGGHGVIHIRMYSDGMRSLCNGWMKAFAVGAGKSAPAALRLSVLWLVGGTLAFLLALAAPFSKVVPLSACAGYVAFAVAMWAGLRKVGAFRWWVSAAYPLSLGFFYGIMAWSVLWGLMGRAVRWKARDLM
jgi:4,4'-diaponeurosporenoate glycosyltransferase